MLAVSAAGRSAKTHWGDGFSIDLDRPYELVVTLARETASDGMVRGTSEYKGTSGLEGATFATASDAFPPQPASGTSFYKVRPRTLAPEHFYDSGDQGTVVVRYRIEPLGPSLTRLRIDATFVGNSHHREHPSDGQVEAAEFGAIAGRLKEIEDREEQEKRIRAAQREAAENERLQRQLEQEKAALAELSQQERQLQAEVAAASRRRTAQIERAAPLKAEPYNSASTIAGLEPGETVTVLLVTHGWYRVKTQRNEEGWVYGQMVTEAR